MLRVGSEPVTAPYPVDSLNKARGQKFRYFSARASDVKVAGSIPKRREDFTVQYSNKNQFHARRSITTPSIVNTVPCKTR